MIKTFNKYICSTCKAKYCDKGIVVVNFNGIKQARCTDYEKDESKIEGYKKTEEITAKKSKALMRLNI